MRKRADQPETARLGTAPPDRVMARHSFHGAATEVVQAGVVHLTTPAYSSTCGLLLPGSPSALARGGTQESLGSSSANGSPGTASKANGTQVGASMERVPSVQLDKVWHFDAVLPPVLYLRDHDNACGYVCLLERCYTVAWYCISVSLDTERKGNGGGGSIAAWPGVEVG